MRLHAAVAAMALAFMLPGVAQASVPAGNLILNPGAEEGAGENDSFGAVIPHWEGASGHLSAVKYASTVDGYPTATDSSAIGGGANFFSGGSNDMTSQGTQLIDIPGAAAEIDAGRVSVTLSAYLGGKLDDLDDATITAKFEDEHSDTVFGMVQIGPVTSDDRNHATKLLPRSATADVPVGTRRLRVIIDATRGTGQHNNAYADNLSLTLDVDPTAVNDSATVAANSSPTAVAVLTNDTNPDGGPKQIASVTQPAHGTVAITGGGSGLTYQPAPGYCNSQSGGAADTFMYTLNGGSKATVAMTVTCAPGAPPAPAVITGAVSAVFPRTATLGGLVNPQGSATTYHFEYGTSTAYGSSTPNASAGAGNADQQVSAPISGLLALTGYHYRLVATSAAGTTLGADREFLSAALTCGSLSAPPLKPFAPAPVTAAAALTGTAGANTIIGTPQSDTIAALGGNDCVLGLPGNDRIDAGSGDDRVDGDGQCPSGTTEASYCFAGGTGNDVVAGGTGDDIIEGSGGRDRLSGQAGDDRLRGEQGNDRAAGGSGRDILTGHTGRDLLSGGSGDDDLNGSSGNDSLTGDEGEDAVDGGSGNDMIRARDGQRDRIRCGSGRDRVSADRDDRVHTDCEHVSRPRSRRN
jgi:Ca2+-binding RTX toxin-like protein